jgi:hypothetical protein
LLKAEFHIIENDRRCQSELVALGVSKFCGHRFGSIHIRHCLHCCKQEEKQIGIQTALLYSSTKMTVSQGKPTDGSAEDRGKKYETAISKRKFDDSRAASKVTRTMQPQPDNHKPLARCNSHRPSTVNFYFCKSEANFANNSVTSSRSAGTLLSFFGRTFGDC